MSAFLSHTAPAHASDALEYYITENYLKMEMQTLQELINKRAAEKLDNDLMAISNFVRGNRLLGETSIPPLTFDMLPDSNTAKVNKDTKAPYWVFQYEKSRYSNIASSAYMDNLRSHWLPVYIQQETKDFMTRVDKLSNDVSDLLQAKEHED